MEVLNITFMISNPRFTFDRSIEYSKDFKVRWFIGWFKSNLISKEPYHSANHQLQLLGRPDGIRNRFIGVFDELMFVLRAVKEMKKIKADLVLVHSHRLAFLYPLLARSENYVLVLYTTAVSTSTMKRKFWDSWEKLVMLPYKKFFVATPEMIDLFGLKEDNCYVTRWGMRPISVTKKSFSSLSLLYIGVLSGRRIDETIAGLRIFLDKHKDVTASYSIIGSGKPEYVEAIRSAIKHNALEEIVTYYGYLPDNEIIPYFDRCNVGVSYVPITPYYTDVIVTKTVEYLLSGLAVIATNTNKNRAMISDDNGVLVSDDPESFAEGLEKIYKSLSSYNSQTIVEGSQEWDLDYNIKNRIVPLLKQIAGSKR
ncbi:MAG: glycosyltransferase [Candidatus Cloacimonetes bacterium]|jgi:glycosyltransferase involved in cell wall biosynthesis|nr:glycosyltransferase [Candidatus Cloacimonadota bacterium]